MKLRDIFSFRVTTVAAQEAETKQAVDDALHEAAQWDVDTREGSNRQFPSQRDPFSVIASGYDRSPVYEQDAGHLRLDPKSLQIRPVEESRLPKVISGLSRVLSEATGGWISIGGQRGILAARDLSEEQLWLAQDAAVLKSKTDPHAQGIVRNLQFYTVGDGVTWSTPSEIVTKALEKFRKENQIARREQAMVKELFQEGEYFAVYFVDPATGRVKVRKHRPKNVPEIETHPDDLETRISYKRELPFSGDNADGFEWDPDINYWIQKADPLSEHTSAHEDEFPGSGKTRYIQFSRYGDQDELRGWPPMYAALRWLKYLEDFIVDRARLHHERAKVVWFQTRKGQTGRKKRGDSSNATPHLAPKGGTMWIEDETTSYRAEALNLDSGDAEKDAMLLLYAISSAVTQPIHVWNQRADQAAYSSLRKADTPFSQAISFNQTFLEREWEIRDRFVLRMLNEHGDLPDEVEITQHDQDAVVKALSKVNEMFVAGADEAEILLEAGKVLAPGIKKVKVPLDEVPITRTFPDVVQESPLELAKVLLIHQKMGIASDSTLSGRSGYDWTDELVQMFQEAEGKRKLAELKTPVPLQKPGAPAAGPPGKGGPGRAPGDGAGGTKVSKDDLGVGGDAPKSTETP